MRSSIVYLAFVMSLADCSTQSVRPTPDSSAGPSLSQFDWNGARPFDLSNHALAPGRPNPPYPWALSYDVTGVFKIDPPAGRVNFRIDSLSLKGMSERVDVTMLQIGMCYFYDLKNDWNIYPRNPLGKINSKAITVNVEPNKGYNISNIGSFSLPTAPDFDPHRAWPCSLLWATSKTSNKVGRLSWSGPGLMQPLNVFTVLPAHETSRVAHYPWMNERLSREAAEQRLSIDQAECNANAWHSLRGPRLTNSSEIILRQEAFLDASSACMIERGWTFGGAPAISGATGATHESARMAACAARPEEPDTRCIVIDGQDLQSCWDWANARSNLNAFCVHRNGTVVWETFFGNLMTSSPPTLCESSGTFEDHGSTVYVRTKLGTCDNGNNLNAIELSCMESVNNLVCHSTKDKRIATYQRTNGIQK